MEWDRYATGCQSCECSWNRTDPIASYEESVWVIRDHVVLVRVRISSGFVNFQSISGILQSTCSRFLLSAIGSAHKNLCKVRDESAVVIHEDLQSFDTSGSGLCVNRFELRRGRADSIECQDMSREFDEIL